MHSEIRIFSKAGCQFWQFWRGRRVTVSELLSKWQLGVLADLKILSTLPGRQRLLLLLDRTGTSLGQNLSDSLYLWPGRHWLGVLDGGRLSDWSIPFRWYDEQENEQENTTVQGTSLGTSSADKTGPLHKYLGEPLLGRQQCISSESMDAPSSPICPYY
jgi:hypothetical protein